MSWIRIGTGISQFLSVFLPILAISYNLSDRRMSLGFDICFIKAFVIVLTTLFKV